MTNFLFDVDGTLTAPRGVISKEFKNFFEVWVNAQKGIGNSVFLVTGSDKQKTVEQIGLSLCGLVDGCYQNCGNQLYKRNSLVKESSWNASLTLTTGIMDVMSESQWFGRSTDNIEHRIGMVNISTVGRSADNELRKEYFMWDEQNGERKKIAERLSSRHPELEFSIGGEISIDVYPKGKDKSQILTDMTGETVFFGDSCHKGGNDYCIANKSGKYHQVAGWEETKKILETHYD
jgi:phosphomannomutase